jgi:hypothetical protein
MDLFIILSPCAFIGEYRRSFNLYNNVLIIHLASCYSVLGQMASRLRAEDCLPIRASRVAAIFVWSDVVTFIIQAAGGSLEIKISTADLGAKACLLSVCSKSGLTDS